MDVVPLLVLLSCLDVVVTMKKKQGCFTPASISCYNTTLSCDDDQIIDLQNIELIGRCKGKDGCVEQKDDKKEFYQFTLKDVISIYNHCSSKHACTIFSPHDVGGNKGDYDYMKYTYQCLEVTTTSTTASTTMDTTLSSNFNSTFPSITENTTNIHIDNNNNSSTDAIQATDDTTASTTTLSSDFNFPTPSTTVYTTNIHIDDNSSTTDAMKETNVTTASTTTLSSKFNSTVPSTTVNTTNTNIDDNKSSTGVITETVCNNICSNTDTIKETDDNSVITAVVVTVIVVIVVEVVVVLIIIYIYRKRRVKHTFNTDRVMKIDKTTDAYQEIPNFSSYETIVDPGLRSTLSSDQAATTNLAETIEVGKTCKPENPVCHILQPGEDEKLPRHHLKAGDTYDYIGENKLDLTASDTYDHIGVKNPIHKDKKQFDAPAQHPSVPLTTLTNYENIKLGDNCNIKDDSTYNHLYSDNNKTEPDAGVTTNLGDDDTYNHLHDTPAHEKPDVSLDIMEDICYTRPGAMNDNSEDNDTCNHLHEG
ncbi:uncharacterized protein LOC126810660 [Patella vulgata]|uniref:uncharacterized protein LOC126810660 n=1 Tax=Patella vulgata TaxID=6465 RepID=UPI0024A92F95|nr:uncharacterized protein LOC126810660 [Patella vulgata]